MKRRLPLLFLILVHLRAQDGSLFLEPHRPFSIGGYRQLVYEKFGMPRSKCSMMVFPSIFGSEYSIQIFEEPNATNGVCYRVEHAIASRLIWQTIPFLTGNASLKQFKAVKIKRLSAVLPFDMAMKIIRVWEMGTKNTRYDNHVRGLDGVDYDFAYERVYFGTAWCPERGYPKLLADIGDELVLFVKATPSERPRNLARIDRIISSSQLPK